MPTSLSTTAPPEPGARGHLPRVRPRHRYGLRILPLATPRSRHRRASPRRQNDLSVWRQRPRQPSGQRSRAADTRAAMTAESTAVCDQQTAEGAGQRSREVQRQGRATDRRPLPARKLADDDARFARTCQDSASGIVDACGPGSPDSHRVVWGLTSRPPVSPCGLSSGFPFARRVPPLRPPSSGFPSSGVLRFVPFGRCPVPVPLRFPSGSPSLGQSSP